MRAPQNELQQRSEAQQRLVTWMIGGTLVLTTVLGILVGGSISRRNRNQRAHRTARRL